VSATAVGQFSDKSAGHRPQASLDLKSSDPTQVPNVSGVR
jgi:hypothetical protein